MDETSTSTGAPPGRYKVVHRFAAGLVVFLELLLIAGFQWALTRGVFHHLPRGRRPGVLLGILHLHSLHFHNVCLWLLIHGLTLATALLVVAFGSPKWVHRVTNGITLWCLAFGALLLITFVIG